LTLNSDTFLYKQWLKGHDNQVADSISRDNYYLNANTHCKFLYKTVPQQLPANFKIKPLPKDVFSFIISTLQQLPEDQPQSSQPKPSELARGNIGILSSIASDWETSTSMGFHRTRGTQYCHDFPKQSGLAPSLREIVNTWRKE